MKGIARIKIQHIIGLAILALIAVAALKPEWLTGIKLGEVAPAPREAEKVPRVVAPVVPGALTGYQVAEVKFFLKDFFNPKAGVSGLTVELLSVPPAPYTTEQLAAIARDPNRVVLDSAVSGPDGNVTFTGGVIFVDKDYLVSIRGDSSYYDKLAVIRVPAGAVKIDKYTFPDITLAYKVGSWASLGADVVVNFTETPQTGIQYKEIDLTISQSAAGAALKNPILMLRSPEGKELYPGSIISLYLVRKGGIDLGLPVTDVVGFIATMPIDIRGDLMDTTEGVDYLTVAGSAVYTAKITYDSDLVQKKLPSELHFTLDDLGGYLSRDFATLNTKASPGVLKLIFTS